MDLEKIRLQQNILEFKIEGEDHTLLNLLREQLSSLPEVQFAAYKLLQHERPKFYVRTEPEENPIDVVSLASSKIIEECDRLLGQLETISKPEK